MTEVNLSSTALNEFHKIDNVLYEINDSNGIQKNVRYDRWKQNVIAQLESSGFIEVQNDLYVLTQEGKEVIEHDSFLYYNKRKTPIKKEVLWAASLQNSMYFVPQVFLALGFIGLIAAYLVVVGI